MPSIPFAKAHGLGNDFLILRQEDVAERDFGRLALTLCDRHTGIGADGLVLLGRSEGADATFRIFNADGSEAGLSGNAMRCAGAWLHREGDAPRTLRLETRVGLRSLFFLRREGAAAIFRTEIGTPVFEARTIPFAPPEPWPEPILGFPLPVDDASVAASILNMGNPQCILFVDSWKDFDWIALGRLLERHAYFPDRANIGFVRVLGTAEIEARFWERGAGHTLASGTGSCACAVAAHLAGKCGRQVRVQLERGALDANWREDGVVELTGPAVITAEGQCFP